MTATYTESLKVKTDAGFENNPDIPVPMIDEYRVSAYHIIRWMIAAKYNLATMDADADFPTSPAAWLLDTIEKIYAAWLLLMKEYTGDDLWTQKWKDKMALAEKLLNQILDSEDGLRLVDSDGNEYTTVATWSAGGPVRTGPTCSPDFTKDQDF